MISLIIVIKSIFELSALVACKNCLQLILDWILSYISIYLPRIIQYIHIYINIMYNIYNIYIYW